MIIQKVEKVLELFSFECQYARINNGIWKGNLINACDLEMSRAIWAASELYKWIFAGNTQMSNIKTPQAPKNLVFLKINKMPNNISKKPLRYTNSMKIKTQILLWLIPDQD